MSAFKLNQREIIGKLQDGTPVYPSVDFIKRWDEFFARIGGHSALSNVELALAISDAEDAANAKPPDIPHHKPSKDYARAAGGPPDPAAHAPHAGKAVTS